MKLVADEDESAPLRAATDGLDLVTSVLAWVEVPRAARRYGGQQRASELLERLAEIDLAAEIIDLARDAQPDTLGSLDAIHLASALSVRSDIAGFIAYDARLVQAARAAGLDVRSPS